MTYHARTVPILWDLAEGTALEGAQTLDDLSPEDKERVDTLLAKLPAIEEDVVRMVSRGCVQENIAIVLGVTQSAVSWRLKNARRRLLWHMTRPPRPESFEADLAVVLRRTRQPELAVQVVADAIDCTSVSQAARRLNLPYETVRKWTYKVIEDVGPGSRAYVDHVRWNVMHETNSRFAQRRTAAEGWRV